MPDSVEIFPEVRIQVSPTRFRVPDIAVYLNEPTEQVFVTPPFLVIEILSPEDRWSRMTRKLEDYFAMGRRNVWIFDPGQSKAYLYDGTVISEIPSEIATSDMSITIQLSALF